ncbi:hypothetical protein [Allomuricauda sp. M10]|uniref:hypothetical protein n=1 Tax=Allomuricauda sp. M10 TaxID=2683292 RepID=UPI001D17F599|nr:hypothetical protein [Muricauda sp. M10]
MPISLESPVYLVGFDYPSFDKISNYAWFRFHYRVLEGTEISLGGEHYRNYFADRFTVSAQLKQNLNKELYLFGGHQREWDLLNKGRGYPNPIPLQEAYFGMGYDAAPGLMIEGRVVRPLGQGDFSKIGFDGFKTRVEMGTRIKF